VGSNPRPADRSGRNGAGLIRMESVARMLKETRMVMTTIEEKNRR